jgi:hypothetical protein
MANAVFDELQRVSHAAIVENERLKRIADWSESKGVG